jgi:hypothetical protein
MRYDHNNERVIDVGKFKEAELRFDETKRLLVVATYGAIGDDAATVESRDVHFKLDMR